MHPKRFLCRRKFKNNWRAYRLFTGKANRTTDLPRVTWGEVGDPARFPTFQEPARRPGGTAAHEFAGITSCKVSLAHPEASFQWQRLSIWWGRQTIRKLFPPNTAWARFFQKLHSPWTMRKSFQMYHGECFLDVGSPWWLNPSWGQLWEFRLNRKMRCACTWQEAWWQVSQLRNGAGEQEHRCLVTWTVAGTACTRHKAAQVLKSQGSGWIFEQSKMLQLPSPNYTPIKNK